MPIERVRNESDGFLVKIKNRILWLLKHYNFLENKNAWKDYKLQLEILNEYIQFSNSKIIHCNVVWILMEVLTVIKKNLIEYCTTFGPFLIDDCNLTLIDNIEFSSYEYVITDEFLDIFCIYLEIISSLTINSNMSKSYIF